LIIPLTGGEVINLECNSSFWAFAVQLSFINLCDHQTILNGIDVNNLPGELPNGYSFVAGLDVDILSENQSMEGLPDGTGIQMDFPISDGSPDQFAALYWSGSEWIEISQQISDAEIPQAISGNSDNEFYQVQNALDAFYQVLTTNKTGIFALVKK
jgi:hypothetical protein